MSDPATDAAIVEELAGALGCHRLEADGGEWCETHGSDWPCQAATLLPVVRRAQAAALREAADDPALSTVTHTANFGLPSRVIPVTALYRRADAIEAGRGER